VIVVEGVITAMKSLAAQSATIASRYDCRDALALATAVLTLGSGSPRSPLISPNRLGTIRTLPRMWKS
jgi:hypothetical protein